MAIAGKLYDMEIREGRCSDGLLGGYSPEGHLSLNGNHFRFVDSDRHCATQQRDRDNDLTSLPKLHQNPL